MRGLLLSDFSAAPTLRNDLDRPEPASADALINVESAAINPMDKLVAGGHYHLGHPPLPYIPGSEAVGRVAQSPDHLPGTPVWTGFLSNLGVTRDGALAESVVVAAEDLVVLPEGVDSDVAVAVGVSGVPAWVALTRIAPVDRDDRVLVLGATGTLGSLAAQIARLRGAGRVVVAGRREPELQRAVDRGADASVLIALSRALAVRFREACGGDGPTVIIDPIWGEPAAAAIDAAAPGARFVQLGQSAGAVAPLRSTPIRGREMTITGWSGGLSRPEIAEAYLELLDHVVTGNIEVDITRVPLSSAAEAWRAGPAFGKQVVTASGS
jgi:NADPH:quinone reductase-like Zn-dependent oxidoreductase